MWFNLYQSLKIRLSEHKLCLMFAAAEQHHRTGYQILDDNTFVVAKCPHFYTSKIRETIEFCGGMLKIATTILVIPSNNFRR